MTTKQRAERTLNLLRSILTHYSGPHGRQVGHTSAVLNGARNTPDCKVIVHNQRMAHVIRQLTKDKTQAIDLLNFEEGMRGHAAPILWDNAALFVLFEQCAHIMGDLLEEAARPGLGPIHEAAHRKEGVALLGSRPDHAPSPEPEPIAWTCPTRFCGHSMTHIEHLVARMDNPCPGCKHPLSDYQPVPF